MAQPGPPLHAYTPDAITREQFTLSRIMGAMIIVFFLVVLFLFVFHIYVRCLLRHGFSTSFLLVTPTATVQHHRAARTGLDKATIAQLPTFIYRAHTSTQAAQYFEAEDKRDSQETGEGRRKSSQTGEKSEASLECAVCLSQFQDNEKGRLMPCCKHAFHLDCIDMWFHSHSTCPLCRTVVVPIQGDAQIRQTAMEEATRTSEQNNGYGLNHGLNASEMPCPAIVHGNQIQVVSCSSSAKDPSCSHSPCLSCMGAHTQISIDIPVSQGNIVVIPAPQVELEASSTHPTRNLGLCLSLKRMLSRE